MSFRPDEDARFIDPSHRMYNGECRDCGTGARWMMAEKPCPLRGWREPEKRRSRKRRRRKKLEAEK